MGLCDNACGQEANQRVEVAVRIYYGPSQKTVLSTFSVNLCTGGVFLKTEFPFKVHEQVTLIFSLPGQDKTIVCKSRVAWINSGYDASKPELPTGVGLQFVDLPQEDELLISNFLDYNNPREEN